MHMYAVYSRLMGTGTRDQTIFINLLMVMRNYLISLIDHLQLNKTRGTKKIPMFLFKARAGLSGSSMLLVRWHASIFYSST